MARRFPVGNNCSPSGISDEETCAYRFWRGHVDPNRPSRELRVGGMPLDAGTIQHAVLQIAGEDFKAGTGPARPEAEQLVKTIDRIPPEEMPADPAALQRAIDGLRECADRVDFTNLIFTEEPLVYSANVEETVVVGMIADAIFKIPMSNGRYCIRGWDYKTGMTTLDQDEADVNAQVVQTLAALRYYYPEAAQIEFVLDYTVRRFRVRSRWTPLVDAFARRQAIRHRRKVEHYTQTGKWPANGIAKPNACRYCPFKMSCPTFLEALENNGKHALEWVVTTGDLAGPMATYVKALALENAAADVKEVCRKAIEPEVRENGWAAGGLYEAKEQPNGGVARYDGEDLPHITKILSNAGCSDEAIRGIVGINSKAVSDLVRDLPRDQQKAVREALDGYAKHQGYHLRVRPASTPFDLDGEETAA
jgi:hypothetical protein